MPARILRPTIRQSKRWNRLGFFEQSLFIRLITIVDDFGRYDGDFHLLRSELFPYAMPNGAEVSMPAFASGMLSLVRQTMIQLYEIEGNVFVQVLRWKERTRSKSRYPDPEKGKLLTNDSECLAHVSHMTASPPTPTPTPTPTPVPPNPQTPDVEKGGIWEFKKRVGVIFQRKETDHWKQPEELELVQVFKRPEAFNELQIVENAYGRGLKYLPQSVGRLLEDWTGTLDKSRNPERQQDNAGGKRPEARQRVEGLKARVVDFTQQDKKP